MPQNRVGMYCKICYDIVWKACTSLVHIVFNSLRRACRIYPCNQSQFGCQAQRVPTDPMQAGKPAHCSRAPTTQASKNAILVLRLRNMMKDLHRLIAISKWALRKALSGISYPWAFPSHSFVMAITSMHFQVTDF